MPKILHPDGRLARVKNAAEKAEILKAVGEAGGSVEAAALLLGLSKRGLYQRIKALDMRVEAGGSALKTLGNDGIC